MPQQQIIMSIGLWVVVIAIFYFLMIRPQKKKDKQLKEMRSSLSVGDKVITIGGIVANVAKVEDDVVILELWDQIELKFHLKNGL